MSRWIGRGLGAGALMAGMCSCIPLADQTGVTGPEGQSTLAVTASTDTPTVVENTTVSLTASATGGREPYVFRWGQNGGPEEVEPAEVASAATTAGPLTTVGRYVFRVIVTDASGNTDTAFVDVEVVPALEVTLEADEAEAFAGQSAALTATVTEGVPPYSFAWELVEGPVELDLGEEASATIEAGPLSAAGEYTFRVTVTDAGDFETASEVVIEVLEPVTTTVPALARADVPVELSAEAQSEAEGVTFLWEVVEGTASLDEPESDSPALTTTADETVVVQLTVTIPSDDGAPTTVTREFEVISVVGTSPRVLIETNFGDLTIELDLAAAPGHTENFLAYVNEGYYDGLLFFRSACEPNEETGDCDPFVLQGGGYERVDDELILREPTRDPIMSESDNGLSNGVPYSVSMALSGSDRDSGQAQFFINLRDNSFLDESGFTVFGQVVDGIEVVDQIAAIETTDSPVIPGEVSLPLEDVIIDRVTRVIP